MNTSPTGSEASIWQSGKVSRWMTRVRNFSESFLKLTPKLELIDWFTPTNHFAVDRGDVDLDSSGATLIPGTHLVLGGGKEGVLYTLATRNLGHLGDEHALQHFRATASHLHSLVFWGSAKRGRLLYVWGQRDKAKVYKFEGDKLGEAPLMMRDMPNEGHPGTMLSLSAMGTRTGSCGQRSMRPGTHGTVAAGVLHAWEADDIRHELWNSLEIPSRVDCSEYSKMAPPTTWAVPSREADEPGHATGGAYGSE